MLHDSVQGTENNQELDLLCDSTDLRCLDVVDDVLGDVHGSKLFARDLNDLADD
jgi:hypothetical protein